MTMKFRLERLPSPVGGLLVVSDSVPDTGRRLFIYPRVESHKCLRGLVCLLFQSPLTRTFCDA